MKKLRLKLREGAIFKSNHDADSGYDVGALGFQRVFQVSEDKYQLQDIHWLDEGEQFTLAPNECALIKTGVCLQLPEPEYNEDEQVLYVTEAQMRPRSGLSLKENTTAILGTIDNPYRNDCGVILKNTNSNPVTFTKGDRVGQIVISKAMKFKNIEVVDSLNTTKRGEKGFGSSGK